MCEAQWAGMSGARASMLSCTSNFSSYRVRISCEVCMAMIRKLGKAIQLGRGMHSYVQDDHTTVATVRSFRTTAPPMALTHSSLVCCVSRFECQC